MPDTTTAPQRYPGPLALDASLSRLLLSWHWHDMNAHFVVVLKGWITFRYAGVDAPVTVHAGGTLSQPAGVAHNVVARSDDMELIEINVPATFGAWDLPGFDPGPQI